ncbi:hypothetical protein [Actinobaculum suis]|uniref:hypothetical protein n=1 Tax=Actinobaculum suis TaxID=1657 RepID=UPI001E2B54FE|nr:hypothetical protein [Actinobaculum suis]
MASFRFRPARDPEGAGGVGGCGCKCARKLAPRPERLGATASGAPGELAETGDTGIPGKPADTGDTGPPGVLGTDEGSVDINVSSRGLFGYA